MANSFSGVIRLRKDTEAAFANIKNAFVPADGECCLVECTKGIRVKVGDGVKTLAQLEYIDTDLINQINEVVTRGYLMNGAFYTDSTYTTLITASISKVYIDANSNVIYTYDAANSKYVSVNDVLPTASDAQAGIAKLYQTLGSNTDGALSQKAATDELNRKFHIEVVEDECIEFSI